MKSKKEERPKGSITFSRISLIIFCSALIFIIAGYLLMSKGNISISPVFLVLGYVILIPLAILKK
ncbi:MAG: hypothetical protein COX48_01170 [bacterium (Candidatus Stahlbacteria) CG23_combo_of_CG06-09_8_20_14_all_34_7]|nr:MAG: hypothetical protein COX48_01170 [bacterium (Candidatus Stahlbacteria) CG23_combo_of_CG06-09_8_20_14_all_34_7]